MERKWILFSIVFTLAFCSVFVILNPNIATQYPTEFHDGEVFMPDNGRYDFRTFTMNCTEAKNFTARIIGCGHEQLIDDTGDITVNVIEPDKMIKYRRDRTNGFLNGELRKPSWSVDGVVVHQIDFKFGGELYSAYQKNSSTNTIIYLSTPNEKETADMMNSLEFKGE